MAFSLLTLVSLLLFCHRRRVVDELQQVNIAPRPTQPPLNADSPSFASYPCIVASQPSICWVSGNMLLTSLMSNNTQVSARR
jgi:hypothetical protein